MQLLKLLGKLITRTWYRQWPKFVKELSDKGPIVATETAALVLYWPNGQRYLGFKFGHVLERIALDIYEGPSLAAAVVVGFLLKIKLKGLAYSDFNKFNIHPD